MAAEAHMKKSTTNEGLAREYINLVRHRAGLGKIDSGLSGDALFNALVKERRLELAMEGHRYDDLIRWGLAGDVLNNEPKDPSNHTGSFIPGVHDKFPIPLQEIQRSGGVLEQNNGY